MNKASNIYLYDAPTPQHGISSVVKYIAPSDAQKLLATSKGNRAIRGWYVDVLAEAMRRDEWRCSHQGIAFDEKGRLIDGHHRLLACIKANVPITVLCVFGVPTEAYPVIDQGINRKVYDVLGIDKRVAEPLRLGATFAFGQQKLTIAQLERIAGTPLLECLEYLIYYCGTTRRNMTTSAVKLGAAMQMLIAPENKIWIAEQYQAGCLLDFESMCPHLQLFCRRAIIKNPRYYQNETMARSFHAFDIAKSNYRKLFMSKSLIEDTCMSIRVKLQDLLL